MNRLEESRGSLPGEDPVQPVPELKQRRRMLAALVVLLLALVLVIVRNREYLYSAPTAADPDATSQSTASAPAPAPSVVSNAPSAAPRVTPSAPKPMPRSRASAPSQTKTPAPELPGAVATDRTALPALQVEVVAGDSHRTVHPGNNSINVEMQPGSSTSDKLPGDTEVATASPAVEASERVRLSSDASKLVTHQVAPDYPLLAKEMKVQGAVILQALIGKEGTIQDLQVLSGPSILSSAAREAVKQWRFKPYYQSGQAVETQARITVNFTISTN